MMLVKKLGQLGKQCEASVAAQSRLYRAQDDDARCRQRSQYVVDGKQLCFRHAGGRVLAYAVERGEI
jgi:hypothetical protein